LSIEEEFEDTKRVIRIPK